MIWGAFGTFWAIGVLLTIATIVIHVFFAFAVYTDAKKLVYGDKKKTVLVPVEVWSVAVLLGGVLVGAAYWIIHRSSIANLEDVPSDFDIKDYLA